MPFYPSDWLAGTARLPRLHRSVYFDVCCYTWDHAKPVPENELRLMCGDVKGWQAIIDDLVEVGKLKRENGFVWNQRALDEAEKARDLTERKSAGGRKSAGNSLTKSVRKTAPIEPEPEPDISLKGNRARARSSTEIFLPPQGVTQETWQTFMEGPRKKHPLTSKSYQLILKAISESSANPEDPVAQSVLNDWRGVFPVKLGKNNGKRSGWL